MGAGVQMAGRTSPRPVRRKRRKVVINLSNCRYPVLEEAASALEWAVTREDKGEWDIFWTDTSVSEERVLRLKKSQRINHFVGMHTLARKTSMARLLRRVGTHLPAAFHFMPQTWILPNEGGSLRKQSKARPRWVIVKPDGSCQGRGIFLTNSAEKACSFSPAAVAQEYVDTPFLIDGFKFDIRIYVLVTSCDPLRVYLYEEGLARFCTKPYKAPSEENAKETIMHLTNYAINKKQDNFVCTNDGASGFKRTLTSVWKWLDDHGHSSQKVIDSIAHLSVATLLAAQPTLVNTTRNLNITSRDDRGLAGFELLGLDVLLDQDLKPWLLEVNHSPSFACENDIDKKLKRQLLIDTLSLLHVSTRYSRILRARDKSEAAMRLNGAPPRCARGDDGGKIRQLRLRHEERNTGGFNRIYPAPLGSEQAELYQEIEAAARRAHAEGDARPATEVVEVKPPAVNTSTDSIRGSDWRQRPSSSLSPPPSPGPLTSSVASAGSGHHSYRYIGGGLAGQRGGARSTLYRFRARSDEAPSSSRRGSLPDDMDDGGGGFAPPFEERDPEEHRSPTSVLGMATGGVHRGLVGLRSRLQRVGSSRDSALSSPAGGDEGGGAGASALRKSLSLQGSCNTFSGEAWADGLPTVSRRLKLRRVHGW